VRPLPSVTVGVGRDPARQRAVFLACGAVLALAVLLAPRETTAAAPAPDLAASLTGGGVAFVLPHLWLAAPPPPLLANDRIDVLASSLDRSTGATLVASDARVLRAQSDAIVLELTAEDVAALAIARARAYLLVLVLRPR
jgi:hypothetical protein